MRRCDNNYSQWFNPLPQHPAVPLVVLSGGQDSTTCLFWALKHFDEVHALSFTYGQKHTHEVEIAKAICAKQQVPYEVMDVPLLGQLGSNSLTDTTLEMDTDKPAGGPPNTFVPGRNLFFLSIAAVYARERGIFDLVTGVGQTDFSGYPDCRDNFIKSLNARSTSPWTSSFACTRRSCGSTKPKRGRWQISWVCSISFAHAPYLLQRRGGRRLRPLSGLQTAPRRARNLFEIQSLISFSLDYVSTRN